MPIGENFFKYDGVSSAEFSKSLRFVYVDTNSDDVAIEGSREYTKIKLSGEEQFRIVDSTLNEPYEFEAEIISDDPLSPTQTRLISNWLFYQLNYKPLEFFDEEYQGLVFYCILTDPTVIRDGLGVRGFKFKVETNSSCAWETEKIALYQRNLNSIIFNNTSDSHKLMIPAYQFTIGDDGGTIQIHNETLNIVTEFKDLKPSECVYVDKFGQIESSLKINRYQNYNKKKLKLKPGENKISITGDVIQFSIKYQNMRRVII